MADRRQVAKGTIGHFALFLLNFFVLVGIIDSTQLFNADLPLFSFLILGYMLVHTVFLLSVQLGVQILELIRIRMPTFLISYYFQFSDEETIPLRLLDPTKSKLAVFVLLLVISGGPIIFPIFAIYGFFLVLALISANPLTPATILEYFELFLNLTPPLLILIVGVVILSIVIIEFRHL